MTQQNSKSIQTILQEALKKDQDLEKSDTLLREIKQIKEGVKTREELVAT